MAPPWLWKGISREKSEELVTEAGLDDGRYLVRSRDGPNKGEYVLCVVFKSKATHHLIKRNEEGQYIINKKTYGGHQKIAQLIKQLKTKTPGWPVVLTMPVPNPESQKNATESASEGKGTEPPSKQNSSSSGGGGGGGGFMAGPISREEAEAAVAVGGLADGNFVVRSRVNKPDEYVLCVVYKGKATHHLMGKNEDGNFVVNKKPYGAHKTVEALIGHLGTKQPGWPVPLSSPKSLGGGGGGGDNGDDADDSAGKEAAKKAEQAAERERREEEAQNLRREEENEKRKQEQEQEQEQEQQEQEQARAQTERDNAITHEVTPAPTNVQPAVHLQTDAVSESSPDSSSMTLTLARAVINLGNRVEEAESKLKNLEQILARLETAA